MDKMEKLCVHIICDNPRAYKALESVCLEHGGAFIDFEQSYESWCIEQQYVEDTVPLHHFRFHQINGVER